jgi:hypothetical protein
MKARGGTLAAAVDGLEQALASDPAGREQDWAVRVGRALGGLEQAARGHGRALAAAGGLPVEVDRPLLPSPTVDRRSGELRRELEGALGEAKALRAKVAGAARRAAGAAPEAGGAEFGVFCRRARRLLGALRRYEVEETDLLQDSITTDLGAGD